MTTALISALTGIPVRGDVAMTGEISLRGRVLPIGGLREKTMAAYCRHIRTVIIPGGNASDLAEIDQTVRAHLQFVTAEHLDTVIRTALVADPLAAPAGDAADSRAAAGDGAGCPAGRCPSEAAGERTDEAMKWEAAAFETSVGKLQQLQPSTLPEIALCGRSNVGKSSLINRLLSRKSLARTSATPGKTATINFYRVDALRLVDLPGYGYAKVSAQEKQRWGQLIEGYFAADRDLRLALQLVDMRHRPRWTIFR